MRAMTLASQGALVVKNPSANAGDDQSLGWRKWQPTPVFLPGESRGQRSLAGYSPLGLKESDTEENAHTRHQLFEVRIIIISVLKLRKWKLW